MSEQEEFEFRLRFEREQSGKTRAKQSADPADWADPTIGMSGFDRFAAGTGKAMTDMARGAGQYLGLVDRADVAESRKRDAALMRTGAGTAGNIAGSIAMLAPLAFVPGANTLLGGAAIGAGTGALQPSASTSETIANTGIGGAAGAALPLLQRGWQMGKAAVQPFYGSGQDKILGGLLNRTAGGNAPEVARRLEDSARPFLGPQQPGMERAIMGELVPGSMPTVGQASGSPSIAALERTAVATQPHVKDAMKEIIDAQNAARVGQLQRLAGADGERAFFAADRDAVAGQMYGAARRIGIDPAKLTPDALENIAKFSARIPDSILNEAKMLAKINGSEMTDATSVSGMHWVKQAIDSRIATAASSGDSTMKAAYTGLKNDLLDGLDKLSPAYGAARKTFAEMSKPINAMDTAALLADKSINKLTGTLMPNAYASALTDKTARTATGFNGATLDGVMDNSGMNMLNNILGDVRRSSAAAKSTGAGSDTVEKLAYSNMIAESGIPGGLLNMGPMKVMGGLLGRVGDSAYGRANRELAAKVAEVMLNPSRAAALMKGATVEEQTAIREALSRIPQGLLLSTPAFANGR